MAVIVAKTGKTTFTTVSAKLHVFAVFPGGSDVPLFAVKNRGYAKVQTSWENAMVPGYKEDFGRWATTTFNVPDGAIFRINAYRSGRSGNERGASAGVYFMVESTGALMEVRMQLPPHRKLNVTEAFVQWRGHVLELDDLPTHGIVIPPTFRRIYTPASVREVLQTTMVEPPLVTVPVKRTETVLIGGEKKKVRVSRTRRKLSLD